jgi:hypothetical protein
VQGAVEHMSVGGGGSSKALARLLAEEIMGNNLGMQKRSIDGKEYLDYLWEYTNSLTTFRWCWCCMGARWQCSVRRLYLEIYRIKIQMSKDVWVKSLFKTTPAIFLMSKDYSSPSLTKATYKKPDCQVQWRESNTLATSLTVSNTCLKQ